MRVKKAGGRVYGADLTAAERKAMNMEIKRQLAEYDMKHSVELEALVLWVLHEVFGWGETRLRRFHDRFAPEIQDLVQRYQLEDDDDVWLCTQKLKDAGIDIAKWP